MNRLYIMYKHHLALAAGAYYTNMSPLVYNAYYTSVFLRQRVYDVALGLSVSREFPPGPPSRGSATHPAALCYKQRSPSPTDLAAAHTRLCSLPTSSSAAASTPITCYSSMSSLPTASSRPMSTPSSPAGIGATQNPSFPTPERFNASSSGSNVITSGGGLKGRRRTGSLGRPQNVPSQHGSKIRPQRTSKVSQKLKILPSPDEQDEESGRDVYSQGVSLLHTLKYCRGNL